MKGIKRRIKENKGFTLVEIIVVLVVLAILAAFAIPTMLGFVSDAKGKALIPEVREVYVAAQATATEFSGTTVMDDTATGEWEGLSNSLSSTRLYSRHQSWSDPSKPEYNLLRVQASRKMYDYIGPDLSANISSVNLLTSPSAKPAGDDAAWTVTVGTDASNPKTGKVTKVVYLRSGYRVTLEGNSATVAKW